MLRSFCNFVQLDPDPHLKSSWIQICIEENCWIRIRKNWMQLQWPTALDMCTQIIIIDLINYLFASGLWIRIHFLRIRIQQFIWMQIRIQLPKKCWSRSSSNKFFFFITLRRVFFSCKRHCSKVRNNEDCANLLLNLNKLAVKTGNVTNFLAFIKFLFDNFSFLVPDRHIECGSISRSENECGSMQIRIHSPGLLLFTFKFLNLF